MSSTIYCFVCNAVVDVDEAHWPHQSDCDGECWCLTVTCPDCCFECTDGTSSRGGSAAFPVAPVVADVGRPSSPGSPVGPVPIHAACGTAQRIERDEPDGLPDTQTNGDPGAATAGASNPTRVRNTNGA